MKFLSLNDNLNISLVNKGINCVVMKELSMTIYKFMRDFQDK